ncbi:hypothetical protein HMPREF1092_01077 [Clostridium thermobutyricum]|uniref:ABC transporter domain-containing protein n=1 Tax=Clostridium thermobutyricum TaxID=29372 RepID=N9XQ44_9CLOT|nr:ATP-binding cassette domain-containing protein [Clostridium thermobutyricum]ENZ01843.1 hypothetical protein HMPREF1092_01077 [Clostridium thermobutyricum]
MIRVEGLNKSYGNKKVVNNVSFNIEKNKITSLIGPNGAGKSTVLSMISRTIKKDSGKIFIDNKELSLWNEDDLSKKIGILKQSNNIIMRLTIQELVEFGRFPHSKGYINNEDKIIVKEALEYMELYEIKDKYIDELSGGQLQRAYIAMVIAQDTEYILLDEPLNNLDMKHSVNIMKRLKNLAEEKDKTIIIVLHDINFASKYSDNIIIFKEGEVIINETKENVIKKEILEDAYEIDFHIHNIDADKICVYF